MDVGDPENIQPQGTTCKSGLYLFIDSFPRSSQNVHNKKLEKESLNGESLEEKSRHHSEKNNTSHCIFLACGPKVLPFKRKRNQPYNTED